MFGKILIWLLFIAFGCFAESTSLDSMTQGKNTPFRTNGLLSASFLKGNVRGNSISNYFFAISLNNRLVIHKREIEHYLSVKMDISYSCFIDSIWIKNEDSFFVSYNRLRNRKEVVKYSFLVSLKTQLADSWNVISNKRLWNGGPFTPGIFTFGYGVGYVMNKNGALNFGLASIKMNSFNTDLEHSYKVQLRSNKIGIHFDYGTSIQLLYNKDIFSFLNYDCRWNFFISGFKKDLVNLDLQTRVTVKLFRFFRIRFGINAFYDPIHTSGFVSKKEILAGFFF